MEEKKKNSSKKPTIRGYKTKEYAISFNINPNELDVAVSKIDSRSSRRKLREAMIGFFQKQDSKLTEEEATKKADEIMPRINEIGNEVSELSIERKKVQAEKDKLRIEKEEKKAKLTEDLSDKEKESINKEIEELDKKIKAKVKEQTKITLGIRKQYKKLGELISEIFKTEATLSVANVSISRAAEKNAPEEEHHEDNPPNGGSSTPAPEEEKKGKEGNGGTEPTPPDKKGEKTTPPDGNHEKPEPSDEIDDSKVFIFGYTRREGDILPKAMLEKRLGRPISPEDFDKDFYVDKKELPDGKGTKYKVYALSKEIWDKYQKAGDKGSVTPEPLDTQSEPDKSNNTPTPAAGKASKGASEPTPEDIDELLKNAQREAAEAAEAETDDSKALTIRDKLKALITEGKMSNKLMLLFGAGTLIGLVSGMTWLGIAGLGGLAITGASKIIGKYRENHSDDEEILEESTEDTERTDEEESRDHSRGREVEGIPHVDTTRMHDPLEDTMMPDETRPKRTGRGDR